MNTESATFIEIPHSHHRTVRIDAILETRMKEFLLARRRKVWQEEAR